MTNEEIETTLAGLSKDDLLKLMRRDRFVKEQQGGRIAQLMTENLELLSVINELNSELAETRQMLAVVGGEAPPVQPELSLET